MPSEGREEIETKPERDPEICAVCDEEGSVATPEGPMCPEHADDLARDLGLE